MDTANIPALLSAIDDLAKLLNGNDATAAFVNLQCAEIDQLAAVLSIAGHAATAAYVISEHATGDDEPDDAHSHVRAQQTAREGTQAIGAIGAARDYAEDLARIRKA